MNSGIIQNYRHYEKYLQFRLVKLKPTPVVRKLVQDAHLRDEFIHQQPTYSPDLKALVIKLLDQHQHVEQVAMLTNLPTPTRYQWLSDWNQLKKSPGKPVGGPIGQTLPP